MITYNREELDYGKLDLQKYDTAKDFLESINGVF